MTLNTGVTIHGTGNSNGYTIVDIDKSMYEDLNYDGMLGQYMDRNGSVLGDNITTAVETLQKRNKRWD